MAVFIWWLFWWLLVSTEEFVSQRSQVNGCLVAVFGLGPSNIE
jgi:hypothetical protein